VTATSRKTKNNMQFMCDKEGDMFAFTSPTQVTTCAAFLGPRGYWAYHVYTRTGLKAYGAKIIPDLTVLLLTGEKYV